MSREEYIASLIEQGYDSLYRFASVTGIPRSTLRYILSNGVHKTSLENMPMILTDAHEKAVMKKYRDTPKMQSAVDRLLGV